MNSSTVYHENFNVHDDEFQPYNIIVEQNSPYTHNHGRVKEHGYAITCAGNKHLLALPPLDEFHFEAAFRYSPIFDVDLNHETVTEWMMIYHYDRASRRGMAVAFSYYDFSKTPLPGFENYSLKIRLLSIDGLCHTELDVAIFHDVRLETEREYAAEVTVDGDSVSGFFNGYEFRFDHADETRGMIGLARNIFFGEVIFRGITVKTTESLAGSVEIPEFTAVIPAVNGGSIPYLLSLSVRRLEGDIGELNIDFHGGLWSESQKERDRGSRYRASEKDTFTTPYVRWNKQKINLKNGLLSVLDRHEWEFLDQFFATTREPLRYTVRFEYPGERMTPYFIFGYEYLICYGFQIQAGGPAEFVFDHAGKLLYQGDALHRSIPAVGIGSDADKRMVGELPVDLDDYEAARLHAETNHYFHEDESIEFSVGVRWNSMEHIRLEISLVDAFFEPFSRDVTSTALPTVEEFGLEYGRWSVIVPTLPCGVYHLLVKIKYGRETIKEQYAAFEVLSKNGSEIPPLVSGLPFLYSTPNEYRDLERDCFDPWNPMPGCDGEHYFACAAFTASPGQRKRVWEALKPYHRQWFLWLTPRTAEDYDYRNFLPALGHADYIYYPLMPFRRGVWRNDLWKGHTYHERHLEILNDFLKERPPLKLMTVEYIASLGADDYPSPKAMTELFSECGGEWMRYFSVRFHQYALAQNEELRRVNPRIKRSSYGPFAQYTSTLKTHHFLRAHGCDPAHGLSAYADGFFQFEDYPYTCGIPVCRGSWAITGIKLFYPDSTIYPEIYEQIQGCCRDVAVAYANPPFGEQLFLPHIPVAQVYECALATAHFADGAWHYWRDNGFMFRDPRQESLAEFVRNWGFIHNHRPLRPLKSPAYVLDISCDDDRYDIGFADFLNWPDYYNNSEEGISYVNEIARQSGISAGFGLKFESLRDLTATDTNLLVLPSLRQASPEIPEQIRRLHREGVALFAVDDVTGLEDLFGVSPDSQQTVVCSLCGNGQTESLFPVKLETHYRSAGAEVLLESDGVPLLFKHQRTALFNGNPGRIGRDSFMGYVKYGRTSVSRLLPQCLGRLLQELIADNLPVQVDGAGSIAYEDCYGNKCLVLIDYSPYSNEQLTGPPISVKVKLNLPDINRIEPFNGNINILAVENGGIKEFEVKIQPRGTAAMVLKTGYGNETQN